MQLRNIMDYYFVEAYSYNTKYKQEDLELLMVLYYVILINCLAKEFITTKLNRNLSLILKRKDGFVTWPTFSTENKY